MTSTKKAMPAVYILSCRGGSQGELGVVRSLGRRGVRVIVVGEYESISAKSKYCAEFHVHPPLFDEPEAGVQFLISLARREADEPVLFPTADPDLMFVSRNREKLKSSFRLFVSDEEIVENLIDKGMFFDYAQRFGLPTPMTSTLHKHSHVLSVVSKYQFPVIIKPLIPQSWGDPRIGRIVNNKKAVVVNSADELVALHQAISEIDDGVVIQEYIPGRDDQLYSLHAYISQNGAIVGAFTGQKVRTCPAYAGIGCYVTSVENTELKELGLDILKRMDYRGLALAQFKKHSESGKYYLLEINPRLSSWNGFATACGVDLPYAAYCDCIGKELPAIGPQKVGMNYIFFEHDLSAMREYVRAGDLKYFEWIRSVLSANSFQYFSLDDMRPFLAALRRWISRQIGKVRRQ